MQDTLAYKQLSFTWFQNDPAGNTTVYYRNGTIAIFNTTGFITYIVAPTALFSVTDNGGYMYYYIATNFTVIYNKPVELELTDEEKAISYLYQDIYSNGTNRTVYRNGTIAIFDS